MQITTSGRIRRVRWVMLLLLCGLFPLAASAEPLATLPPEAKRLLFLYSYNYGSKGVELFNEGFRNTLVEAGLSVTDISSEYLDLERTKSDPDYHARLLDLLKRKYDERPPALLLTGQAPALEFLLDEGRDLAPGAPIISTLAPTPSPAEVGSRHLLSSSAQFDVKHTLEQALTLFPDTRRLVFVSGSSEADRRLLDAVVEAAAEAAAPWKDRVAFELTHELTLEDTLRRVATLPPQSLVLYTQFNRDVRGQIRVAYEVERLVVKAANAPVFGLYDYNLFNGGVGGSVLAVKRLGENTARLVLELLQGERHPDETVSVLNSEAVPMYDWAQLKRWGADPSRLPAETVFINREVSFWEQYRDYAIGTALFLLAQTLLIAALLVQRQRRQKVEMLLKESEARWTFALEGAGDGVWDWDMSSGKAFLSQRWKAMLGYAEDEIGDSSEEWVSRVHPDDLPDVMATLQAHLDGKTPSAMVENRLRCKDGSWKWVLGRGMVVSRDTAGKPLRFVGTNTDITERKKVEQSLRQGEEQLRLVLEGAELGYWDWNIATGRVERNARWAEMLGYTYEEIQTTAQQWTDFIYPADRERAWQSISDVLEGRAKSHNLEYRMLHKDGSIRWILDQANVIQRNAAGEPVRMCGTHSDITERKQTEEKINTLAFYDQLTGLPNRILLVDRLAQAMASAERNDTLGAMLFIDLDNFKTLNDTRGHEIGDLLLKQVAERLKSNTRAEDTVARQGGDEFVVLLSGLGSAETEAAQAAEAIANKLLFELNCDYRIGDLTHRSTASIGVALFKGKSTSVDELMKQADLALYRAKASGRSVVRFFDPAIEEAVKARADLEADLRRAIAEKQFLLHYQPQVLGDGRVTGAEVLVRWQHPQRGMVPPADFIQLAEDTDLILPLGLWVLETACERLAAWSHEPRLAGLSIAVNVSVKQFLQPDFVEQVLSAVKRVGADSHRLKIELTETLLVQEIEQTIEKMHRLKARGIGFSLDDFGTGYSSLSYLKQLPLDQLKIDQSFVRDVLSDPNDAAIAKTIVALAQSLGLGVIAEGVETHEQKDFLASNGCYAYQGYYFSKPLPVEEFEAFVRRRGDASEGFAG